MKHFVYITCLFLLSGQTLAQSQVSFVDVAPAMGIDYAGKTFGSSWSDLNGDGMPDLFISCHANANDLYYDNDIPVLYINFGTQFFANFFVSGSSPNNQIKNDWHGVSFFDVDRDGDLDMLASLGGNADNAFYLNNNNLSINDLAQAYNLTKPNSSGRTPGLLDINADGFTDVISNGTAGAGGPPNLLINNAGEIFEDQSAAYNLNWTSSVFSTTTDLNNDGSFDLLSLSTRTRIQTLEGDALTPTQNVGSNQVNDFIVEDLNGDLLPDIFHVRADRLVYAEQLNNNLIRAHVSLFLPLDPVSFNVATAGVEIKVKIFPRSPIDSYYIHVGDSVLPMVTGEVTTLTLNSLDENVVRNSPIEFSGITPRFYVSYNQVSQKWEITSKSGTTNKRPFGIEVTGNNILLEDNFPEKPNLGGELFYNQGSRTFNQLETSVFDADDNLMAVVTADFDNDMDLDLYAVCTNNAANKPNILWENTGDGNWVRHEGALGAAGDGPGIGENVTTVDYNNDGFMDLFVTNGHEVYWLDDAKVQLYENQGNDNNWLKIDLKGVVSEPMGLHAKVLVTAGGITQMRYQHGGIHRFSQNDPRLHFGLAQNDTVQSIEIFWQSGVHQVLQNVPANQILTIQEAETCEAPYPVAQNLTSTVLPNGVLLNWDPIPGSVDCTVNGGKVGRPGNISFFTNELNSSQFFVPQSQLQTGETYRWRVRCRCSDQVTGVFTPFEFFSWGVGAALQMQETGFGQVFPNPVHADELNVLINFPVESASASFFDVQGKLVKREIISADQGQVWQFDISELDPGIYFLHLSNGSEVASHKIVRQ